jgi:hypothetical protein
MGNLPRLSSLRKSGASNVSGAQNLVSEILKQKDSVNALEKKSKHVIYSHIFCPFSDLVTMGAETR